MASLDDIERALRAADAAGNTDDARALSQAYTQMKGAAQPSPTQSPPASGNRLLDAVRRTGIDMARAVPGGLAKGAAGLAGLPGDIASMGQPANAPAPQGWLDRVEQATRPANILPRSGTIANAMAAPFGGFYKPQTTPGQYAETAASFAPAALGAPSIASGLARVAAPALGSETAGQLTKGTSAEPYARMGGAILGGGLQGIGGGMLAERAQTGATPTTARVQQDASGQYRAIAGTPVTVTPEMQSALGGDLGRQAINHALAGADANREAYLITELQSLIGRNPPTQISVETADKISQAMRDIGRGAMRGETPNANLARGAYGRRADIETTVGQVPEVQPARAAYAQGRKAADIDAAIDAARNRPNTPAGAGDLNQAYRREFGKLVTDEDFMRGLTPAEREAVSRVANGDFSANVLQRLGKFSPVKQALIAGGEIGLGIGNPGHATAIAAAAGGAEAARQAGIIATARNARLASELVRGGPATRMIARTGSRRALVAAALAAFNGGR